MRLYGSYIMPLIFITHRGRLARELRKHPLHWSESTVSGELVDGGDAFRESHVYLLSTNGVGLLDHLVEHMLQGLVATLNTTNLLGAFKRSWVNSHTFLAQRLRKHTTVVCPTICCNPW